MHDQAKVLRQLVHAAPLPARQLEPARPRLVALTGAKGGVGTTTLAVNLGIELVRLGRATLLVDADPDGGDAATLCGLEGRWSVADVLAGRCSVAEAIQRGPHGLDVLAGAWGLDMMAQCSATAQEELLGQLGRLAPKTQIVLVDTGSGINRLVRWWWQAADLVLVVTTPELASVMDAYGMIKVLAGHQRRLSVASVVNQASDAAVAADVHARLARACARFLGLRVIPAGHVPPDAQLSQPGARPAAIGVLAAAVSHQQPASNCLARACGVSWTPSDRLGEDRGGRLAANSGSTETDSTGQENRPRRSLEPR